MRQIPSIPNVTNSPTLKELPSLIGLGWKFAKNHAKNEKRKKRRRERITKYCHKFTNKQYSILSLSLSIRIYTNRVVISVLTQIRHAISFKELYRTGSDKVRLQLGWRTDAEPPGLDPFDLQINRSLNRTTIQEDKRTPICEASSRHLALPSLLPRHGAMTSGRV